MDTSFRKLAIDKDGPALQAEMFKESSRVRLLSLPRELLHRIIQYLLGPTDDLDFWVDRRKRCSKYGVEPEIRHVYALRLVCKRLYEVANSEFMPMLRIRLTKASLARAEDVLTHAHISQNIRGIELLLEYRPDNMAHDFETFLNFRIGELSDLQGEWTEFKSQVGDDYEEWSPAELDEEANRIFNTEIKDAPFAEEPTNQFYESLAQYKVLAYERWNSIYDTWMEGQDETKDDLPDDPKRQILRQSFQLFQTQYQEQYKLVESGEFTSRVSAMCAGLPKLASLIFSDKEHNQEEIEAVLKDPDACVMFDDKKMLKYLSGPVVWSSAMNDEAPSTFIYPHIAASRLIWDIPIALYQVNVHLRGLHLRCFPVQRNYPTGVISNQEAYNDTYDKVLAQLESFYVTLDDTIPITPTGIYIAYEERIPDLVTSSEVQLFNYMARRIAASPDMRYFVLRLPDSKNTEMASEKIFYTDANIISAPDALKEVKRTWLKKAYVVMWAPKHMATLLLEHLQQLQLPWDKIKQKKQ